MDAPHPPCARSYADPGCSPVYSTLAFRNAYGGSIARTLVKEGAIGAIYGVTCLLGFILMIYWVSLLG